MSASHSLLKSLATVFLTGVCALALSACSSGNEALNADLAPPKTSAMTDGAAMSPLPDPRMKGALGVRDDAYFNAGLQEATARLHGMEETLGRLQSDLQGTTMAIQRVEIMRQEIMALNQKIDSLRAQLGAGDAVQPEQMSPQTGEAVTPETAPMALMPEAAKREAAEKMQPVMEEKQETKTAAVEKPAPAPEKAKVEDGVSGLRFGVHEKSVRIVFDVMGDETKFSANLDPVEKILTVELPKTQWAAAPDKGDVKNNPLLSSYVVQPSGKGTIIAFTLKADTKVLQMNTLKGEGKTPTRLLVDLAR